MFKSTPTDAIDFQLRFMITTKYTEHMVEPAPELTWDKNICLGVSTVVLDQQFMEIIRKVGVSDELVEWVKRGLQESLDDETAY